MRFGAVFVRTDFGLYLSCLLHPLKARKLWWNSYSEALLQDDASRSPEAVAFLSEKSGLVAQVQNPRPTVTQDYGRFFHMKPKFTAGFAHCRLPFIV